MSPRPLTRRVLVTSGLLGAAALSGCSVSGLTTRKLVDPQASDRALLQQASDLSVNLRGTIDATLSQDPKSIGEVTGIRALHTQQIAQFIRSGGLNDPSRQVSNASNPGPIPVTAEELRTLERQLAQNLRGLAMRAQLGDVAALLASAAAGIDQAWAR